MVPTKMLNHNTLIPQESAKITQKKGKTFSYIYKKRTSGVVRVGGCEISL